MMKSWEADWNEFGFSAWSGEVGPMPTAHQHGEIELNLLLRGAVTYLFGGQVLTLRAGQLALFWGSLPHRLTEAEPHTRMAVLTLPLTTFLRFGLPASFAEAVLRGEVQSADADTLLDAALLARWQADALDGDPTRRQIAELEVEARLRRLALLVRSQATGQSVAHAQLPRRLHLAADLARFAAAHAQSPLTLGEIAASQGLHVNYASTLFREVFGLTLHQYLLGHRLAHAQRLLLTTRRPVMEIALDAGFGSLSRFYAAFGAACGLTPLAYRRRGGLEGAPQSVSKS